MDCLKNRLSELKLNNTKSNQNRLMSPPPSKIDLSTNISESIIECPNILTIKILLKVKFKDKDKAKG